MRGTWIAYGQGLVSVLFEVVTKMKTLRIRMRYTDMNISHENNGLMEKGILNFILDHTWHQIIQP